MDLIDGARAPLGQEHPELIVGRESGHQFGMTGVFQADAAQDVRRLDLRHIAVFIGNEF